MYLNGGSAVTVILHTLLHVVHRLVQQIGVHPTGGPAEVRIIVRVVEQIEPFVHVPGHEGAGVHMHGVQGVHVEKGRGVARRGQLRDELCLQVGVAAPGYNLHLGQVLRGDDGHLRMVVREKISK